MINSPIKNNLNNWVSTVKLKLQDGQPVFGITITVNSVEIAAQVANMGFDFLWLEMEHSPITLETVRNMVLATRGLPAIPFARLAVNQLWTAKQVLDAGVLGVIFPFTSTPELAQQAVDACKYPPLGRRGSGASQATFRWPAPQGYYDFADENVLVVVIIEDMLALENIDAIAATPGIDVIFIGTGDLSFALSLRGEQNHPKLEAAIKKIMVAAKRNNKVLGRPAGSPEEAKKHIDQGFLFFQAVAEINLMTAGAEKFLSPLAKSTTQQKVKLNY